MNEKILKSLQRNEQHRVEKASKMEQRRQRKRSRAECFNGLAARNRKLTERANRLSNVLNFRESHTGQSRAVEVQPLVILKTPTAKNPNVGIVGKISHIEYPKGFKRLSAYTIERVDIENIQADLPVSIYNYNAAKSEQTYGITRGTQKTHGSDFISEEIVRNAEDWSTKSAFNPINALWKRIAYLRMDRRLDDFEETITLFEEAAADPERNPQLVPFFGHAEIAA